VGLSTERKVWVWTNDAAGRAELSDWVVAQAASLVVVEASGGYEAALVSELVARGYEVALVNPTWVRAFAPAEGILVKTDKIDAGVIARFGATMKPQARARRDEDQVALDEQITHRRQLWSYRILIRRSVSPVSVASAWTGVGLDREATGLNFYSGGTRGRPGKVANQSTKTSLQPPASAVATLPKKRTSGEVAFSPCRYQLSEQSLSGHQPMACPSTNRCTVPLM
jgi:hypothetical protein